MKLLASAALIAALLPFTAPAAINVKDIDVEVDIDAMQNARAARYWGQLEADLEGAILARLIDRIAVDGVRLNIDVDEVELSNAFEELGNTADTRLVAKVKQTHDIDNSKFKTYDISIDINAAMLLLPAGTDVEVVKMGTPQMYRALVDAFADEVVKRIV